MGEAMINKTQAQYLDLVTPGMLRAAQLRSELGAYAASELSGAYDLITELYGVMHAAADPVPPAGGEPVPEYFVAACNKFDWTPEEALCFYAEGKHFDVVDGRTRILCTGAIASHALKGMSKYTELCQVVRELLELIITDDDTPTTGSPCHGHTTPGHWDEDGSECLECKAYDRLRELVK